VGVTPRRKLDYHSCLIHMTAYSTYSQLICTPPPPVRMPRT
jgi:hypothetical protein